MSSIPVASTPPPSVTFQPSQSQPQASQKNLSRRNYSRTSSSQANLSQNKSASKHRIAKKAPNFRKPQSFVTIIVDKDTAKSTFVVHKDLLCHHSSFFSNAFSGDFVEAQTQTMEMGDVDCGVFGLMVHWLYTQTIELEDDEDSHSQLRDTTDSLTMLADLWTLADVCAIQKLQNEVMAMLHPRVHFADPDALNKFVFGVYKFNVGKSKLKRMVVGKVALGSSEKELLAWIQGGGMPEGMMIDVMTLKRCKGENGEVSVERYFV